MPGALLRIVDGIREHSVDGATTLLAHTRPSGRADERVGETHPLVLHLEYVRLERGPQLRVDPYAPEHVFARVGKRCYTEQGVTGRGGSSRSRAPTMSWRLRGRRISPDSFTSIPERPSSSAKNGLPPDAASYRARSSLRIEAEPKTEP